MPESRTLLWHDGVMETLERHAGGPATYQCTLVVPRDFYDLIPGALAILAMEILGEEQRPAAGYTYGHCTLVRR